MTLSELMAGFSPDLTYEGWVTNDDMVLAVDTSANKNANPEDYIVVQMGVAGLDAQMNPVTVDKQYIRAGQSTTKTGTQRTFSVTGDRYIGDPFQDYTFSHEIMYGVGNAVIVPYVYFCVLNGVGEKGSVSIIPNSDGSGNAGESAAVDITLSKVGVNPDQYVFGTSGTLQSITVTSVAGSTSGDTLLTATPSVPSGMSAIYRSGVSVTLPAYGDILTTMWSPFTSGNEYTITNGYEVVVAYVDSTTNECKYAGKTTVVS